MENLTKEQIKEVIEYLKKWDKRSTFKFGYWFKLIDDTKIEVFNKEETIFKVINLKS